MKRDVVKIDESLCDGCGNCINGCHEGALQLIDGKARLVSDLLCDGLGACIGHCPQGAITIEKREAEPYDEIRVMRLMLEKGKNTVIAHMKHLKEHGETGFLKQAVAFLKENESTIPFNINEVIREIHGLHVAGMSAHQGGGCPGSQAQTINRQAATFSMATESPQAQSELRQWPVQMHLINPAASYYRESDLLIAADCVAFAMGNFHQKILKGKSLAIACPKLDQNQSVYIDKLIALIEQAQINTLTVAIMQVPCCGGLLQMAKTAIAQASRTIPIKLMVISIEGEVLKEEWV